MAEEKKFRYPVRADDHYELLGLAPLREYSAEAIKKAFDERFQYWQGIADLQAKDAAKNEIIHAKDVLLSKVEKGNYDAVLRAKFLKNLEELIELAVEHDHLLDSNEEKSIFQKGRAKGLADAEIKRRIDEVLQKHGAKRGEAKKPEPVVPPPSPITLQGQPVLEIVEAAQKRRFVFAGVKLRAKPQGEFTVKNGGGGSLFADVVSSAAWLIAHPDKIEQQHLPQKVTLTVDPSQDPRCTLGFRERALLELKYHSGGSAKTERIEVDLALEGYEETVARHTRYAAWSAAGLAGLYLAYLINTVRFTLGYFLTNLGGRFTGGLAVEIALGALLFLLGALAVSKDKKAGYWLIIAGAAGLALVSLAALLALLCIPLTWAIAKPVFKKYPTQQAYIAAVPSVVFMSIWLSQSFFPTNLIAHFTMPVRIAAPQAEPMLPVATVIAPEGARLRARPSKNSNTITTIKNGASVKVLNREREWYHVQYEAGGRTQLGYVFQDLLRVSGNVPVAMGGAATPPPSSASQAESSAVAKDTTAAPASDTSATEPQATFTFTIHSQPGGAKLFVNGAARGETPQSLALVAGNYALRLEHAGFHDLHDSLRVGEEMDPEYTFELEAQHAILGKWEGTFGDKPLVIVIESLQGETVKGYNILRVNETSETVRMELEGKWEASAAAVTLTQHGQGLLGTFTGKLSADGARLSGRWVFAQDEALTAQWSVQRVEE